MGADVRWRRGLIGAVTLLAVTAPLARAGELDEDALRAAVRMPSVELRVAMEWERPPALLARADADAMEAELRTGAPPAERLLAIGDALRESSRADIARAAYARAEEAFASAAARPSATAADVAGRVRSLAALDRPTDAMEAARRWLADHAGDRVVGRELAEVLCVKAGLLLDGERLTGGLDLFGAGRRATEAEARATVDLLREAWGLVAPAEARDAEVRTVVETRLRAGLLLQRAVAYGAPDGSVLADVLETLPGRPVEDAVTIATADAEWIPLVAVAIAADRETATLLAGRGVPSGESGSRPAPQAWVAASAAAVRRALESLDSWAAREVQAEGRGTDALVAAGCARLALEHRAPAREHLEAAVRRDPANEDAWDFLLGAALQARDADAMVDVSRRRCEVAATPRNRLLLAKSLDRAGRVADAREALGAIGDDPTMRLAADVLRFRTATSEEARAAIETDVAPTAATDAPGVHGQPSAPSRDLLAEREALRAARRALAGDVAGARAALEGLDPGLRRHPAVEAVRRVLERAR